MYIVPSTQKKNHLVHDYYCIAVDCSYVVRVEMLAMGTVYSLYLCILWAQQVSDITKPMFYLWLKFATARCYSE